MKPLLLFLIFFSSATAHATDGNGFYVGLGTVFQNMFKVTNDATAQRSLLGEGYLPELAVGYRINRFLPTLGYTIVGRKANDGDKKRSLARFDFSYLFPINDELDIKASAGFWNYRISGSGSTITLRNGSSTQNFFVPEGTVSTRIFYVGGGLGFLFGPSKNLRADGEFLIGGPLSTRRSLNLSIRGGCVF